MSGSPFNYIPKSSLPEIIWSKSNYKLHIQNAHEDMSIDDIHRFGNHNPINGRRVTLSIMDDLKEDINKVTGIKSFIDKYL